MSNVSVTGNLVADPELRFSQAGLQYLRFTIAENRKRGEEETAHFYDCTAFGDLAENLANSCGKGTRIFVDGYLEQSKWESPEGEKRSKVQIVVNEAGPSLRWATAAITRNEPKEGGGPASARAALAGNATPGRDLLDNEAPFD